MIGAQDEESDLLTTDIPSIKKADLPELANLLQLCLGEFVGKGKSSKNICRYLRRLTFLYRSGNTYIDPKEFHRFHKFSPRADPNKVVSNQMGRLAKRIDTFFSGHPEMPKKAAYIGKFQFRLIKNNSVISSNPLEQRISESSIIELISEVRNLHSEYQSTKLLLNECITSLNRIVDKQTDNPHEEIITPSIE